MVVRKNLYDLAYGSFVGATRGYCGLRNMLRMSKFTGLLRPAKEDWILEIGCNGGYLVFHLSRFCDHVCGVDINIEQVNKVNDKRIQCMSATDLQFENETFDKVCAFEVIEHIPDLRSVLQEVCRVLKPEGKFVVSFPFEFIRGQAALFDAISIYRKPLYARTLHVHRLTPKKIRSIIQDIPLKVARSDICLLPYPTFVMIIDKQ